MTGGNQPNSKVSMVIFEGGEPSSKIDEQMVEIRKKIVLDNLDKIEQVDAIDEIIVFTNYDDLARDLQSRDVIVDTRFPSGDFHFGEKLREMVAEYDLQKVFYMSGAAGPLLREGDFTWVVEQLLASDEVVVVNNVQSADIVAFAPASSVNSIDLPATDNFLGYLLKEAGLERVLIPNSARINFDIDTPTDVIILALQPGVGPRTKKIIEEVGWEFKRMRRAMEVLKEKRREVILMGRVGAPIMTSLTKNIGCRLRVFSEERGMKALGRARRQEVVSLIGHFVEEVGIEEFIDYLASIAEVAFLDTRVLFAHWKKHVSAWDRFHSDLGEWWEIGDPEVRRLTKAAVEADPPIILGGHSLVYGGLWLLIERVMAMRKAEED